MRCAITRSSPSRLAWTAARVPDYTAIYVPDPEVRFHRLSFPAAFSPHNAPPGQSIIQAEITTNPGDGTHEMSDEDLLADVINDLQDMDLARRSEVCYARVLRTKYGYVVQNDDCRRYLKLAKAYFEQIGIPLCGRVAEFEYINMDVCIERARKVADRLNREHPCPGTDGNVPMMPSRRPYFEIANPEIPRIHRGSSARPARAGCRMRLGRAWCGITTLARPSGGWRGSFGRFHRKGEDASRGRLCRRRHPAGRVSIQRPKPIRCHFVLRHARTSGRSAGCFATALSAAGARRFYSDLPAQRRHMECAPGLAVSADSSTATPARWTARTCVFSLAAAFVGSSATPASLFSRKRVTPGILRPFVPFIKRMYGKGTETGQQGDSSSIMDSAPYRAYQRLLYPLERWICGLWPGLLAFQFVILAQPAALPGSIAVDHIPGDLAALETLSSK